MKPSIYYPVKPLHINQAFGANLPCVKDFGLPTQRIVTGTDNNTCPVGYTKLYAEFGMKGHDGTDLEAGVQNVYAALDGTVIEMQTNARLGLGLGIVSPQIFDLDTNGSHYLKLRYWHLKSFAVTVGQTIHVGDLIGVSDNTGYSSGNHLHFEGMPMDKNSAGQYNQAIYNDYAGAIDIAPYFNGLFAQDVALMNKYQLLISLLEKILSLLKGRVTNQP